MARRAQQRKAAYLHRMREHARQPEGDLLGVLLAVHRDLETVAEVDVYDLAREALEHQVRRVPVTQTQNVADHAVDGE